MAYNTKVEELYELQEATYEEMRKLMRPEDAEWPQEDEERWAKLDAEHSAREEEIRQEEARCEREARMLVIEEQRDRQKFEDKREVQQMRAEREGRVPGCSDDDTRSLAIAAWANPYNEDRRCLQAAHHTGLNINRRAMLFRIFQPRIPSELGDEQVPDCRGSFNARIKELVAERRALGISTGSTGGYLSPTEMSMNFEIALLQFAAPRRYSSVQRTATGAEVTWPTVDDTSNTAEIVGENAATGEQDVAFGQYATRPHMYSSKRVKVSFQLMQDSAFAVAPMLGTLLGTRIGRRQATDFTTGDGASKPSGILDGATDSGVALAADNAPTLANIVDLKHSVDPDYRQSGQGFLLPDTVIASIKKITADGQPLWQSGLASGEPNTIDGDPYFSNQQVPTAAATGTKSMAYGQLNKYQIHDALDIQVIRLDELYAANLQVGFIAYMRSDGVLLDAGTAPVKYATNP